MAIEECPFTLCYDSEALILIKIGVTSYRVEHFNPEVNEQGIRCNLDLMDKLRDLARIRQASYNQCIARYYNRRVHVRSFMPEDLVLRRFDVSYPRDVNKLTPNWEGPYQVVESLSLGAYRLEDMEGKPLKHARNV